MNSALKTAVAVALAPVVLLAFDANEKEALRSLAKKSEAALRTANALDGKAITLLPVRGDADGYFERLLVGAVVNSGKNCVVGNDEEKDARFRRILGEIKWDERQTTLKSVDPATIDRLGSLKSTQVLLEAVLDVEKKGEKEVSVELNLLAYAIETKQYVWSVNIADGTVERAKTITQSQPTTPSPEAVRVNVVACGGLAPIVAHQAAAEARNALAKAGYVVDGGDEPDVVVSVSAGREVLDRSGDWFVYRGVVHLKTEIKGPKPRFMAEKEVVGTGRRGLGETFAEKNLADALVPGIAKWVKDSVDEGSVGLRVSLVELRMDEPVKSAGELALQSAFCKAAYAETGVRSVRLVSQDSEKGAFTFRVVFDAERFPDGFLNTLMVKNPGWKLGYVK